MKEISRRTFLKYMGLGSAAAFAACAGKKANDEEATGEPPMGQMTYRTNPKTGEKVSLLGYGMMRLPTLPDSEEFDQEMINRQTDYAIEHGLNYFDTSPAVFRSTAPALPCTGISAKTISWPQNSPTSAMPRVRAPCRCIRTRSGNCRWTI